ncbi:hypothetical protein [Micromonospora carbonacea]|uniref:Uncharacterized protein n=1 Tax=Micromonospora carbonacea TaxID=47853 RepID=A0A1C5ADK0_9ACTN|nr:hypothetical protein [Micromonospora carbonacea]SCF43141.1 hypothetical protein GA0070563_112193 [Micromonospora carbonacea]
MSAGDKLAMFGVAVGLTTALVLLTAGIVGDWRQHRAENARTERVHAAVLADTRRWQGTSAVAQHRAAARPSLLTAARVWVAGVVAPRPAAAPEATTADDIPAPPADAAADVWPVVNGRYAGSNPTVATGRAKAISRPTYEDIDRMAAELRAHANDPDRTAWMPLVESRKATR